MRHAIASFILGLSIASAALGQAVPSPLSDLFTQLGLTKQQRAAIDAGHPASKVLPWGGPSEIYAFGAVYIEGSLTTCERAARNIEQLEGTPGYLAIDEIPANVTTEDLRGLTLEPDDIKALKVCRDGDCDVQLPTASIQSFHDTVNWAQPDATDQANRLARGMVVDLIRHYREGGNQALGVYRDKQNPARVAEQFELMLSRSATLPDMVPELREYLLKFPDAALPGAESFFYWEKVAFGLRPTIRVNHAVIYHAGDRTAGTSVVAIKQLYASHYFHTALDVSLCTRDAARPERRGFYLITLKSSEQNGLTGAKGSMLRKVVVNKTGSSLESALVSFKQRAER